MESSISNIRPNLSDAVDRINNQGNNDVQPETVRSQVETAVETQADLSAESSRLIGNRNTLTEDEQSEQLANAIETVSNFIEPQIRNVNFTQDESTGQRVIRVFDAESDELIKQFPSEEILELAERIRGLQEEIVDKTGILIDDKV